MSLSEPVRLRRASPAQWALARALLQQEGDGTGELAGVEEATRRAVGRLVQHLGGFFGQEGVWVMLNRALTLARREYSFLGKVELLQNCELGGLDDVMAGIEAGIAVEGMTAILANVVWLLSSLVGEELTLRLIGEVWPVQGK